MLDLHPHYSSLAKSWRGGRAVKTATAFFAVMLGLSLWFEMAEQRQPDGVALPLAAAAASDTATPGRSGDEQQRRVMLILYMNSAGSVRAFGNLGR